MRGLRGMAAGSILLAGLLLGCSSGTSGDALPAPAPSGAKFAVLSDVHLHDAATLGASGADWDAYMAEDRKLLKESGEVLDTVLSDLKGRDLDFVLITGDLTKDGEKVNHQLLAGKLATLRAAGKKVFVLPGNHDINNPHAVSYKSTPATPVEQVTPADFKAIYADCGYNAALYQDPASLSYVAEPVQGLWLFALDSADYGNNATLNTPVTAGRFTPATQDWVLARLQDAKAKGKMVIGALHHGLVEHFAGQAQAFPEYLLTGYSTVGKSFADAGMNLVFTGHFHANDVAARDFGTSRLVDCETGSLVTTPCPYRLVSADFATRTLSGTTSRVTAIPSHPSDWVSYGTQFVSAGLTNVTLAQLTHAPYNLPAVQANALAPLVVAGMMAHYAGDEKLTDSTMTATINGLAGSADPAAHALGLSLLSLWTDPAPADNTFTVSLK